MRWAEISIEVPPLSVEPVSAALMEVGCSGVAIFDLKFEDDRRELGTADRFPVFSAGGAARVNLLGAIVLEGYLAFPFQRPNKSGVWGLQIVSGW